MKIPRKFTQEDEARARELRSTGLSWDTIGRTIGRDGPSIAAHMQRLEETPEHRAARLKHHRSYYDAQDKRKRREQESKRRSQKSEWVEGRGPQDHRTMAASLVPDSEAVADMQRVRESNPVDLTALLMGDPLPSRSALDRKQKGGVK